MKQRLVFLACGVLLLGAAVLAWRYTPLADFATPERLTQWIGTFQSKPWAPAAVIGLYIVGGLVVFPLTLLIVATALVFSPAAALSIAFTGALGSAAVLYGAGSRLIRGPLHNAFGHVVGRINRSLETRGVIAVALLRLVPIAPFTLINLAAGSVGVRFRDYLLGTALGIAPGIAVITAFGSRLRAMWEHPDPSNIAILVGIVVGWIAISLLLQWAVSRRRRNQPPG